MLRIFYDDFDQIVKNIHDEMDLHHSYKKKRVHIVFVSRFGKPSELAGIAVFLVSDEASYITGETVLVTGGMTARL